MFSQISPCTTKQMCCVFIWPIQNSKIYSCVFLCRGQISLIAIYSLQSIDINTITVLWFKITILFTANTCIYLKITSIICKQYVISVLKIWCVISSYSSNGSTNMTFSLRNITHFHINLINNSQSLKHFIGVALYHNQNIIMPVTTYIITY